MSNETFVGNLLSFLNFILKSFGLAPFLYLKSKRVVVHCKRSTILSYVISGFIVTMSLPVEFMAAMHYKPYRVNTVSYAIGYLHILFTLVNIWLNQILTIANRSKIIRHFNQAFRINGILESLCQEEQLLDDKMVQKIKFRISLFVLQSLAIVFGVNAYISFHFFQHSAMLLVRIFVTFSYINSIFVNTVYLGGSLMLCERYCRILYERVRGLVNDVNGRTEQNQQNLALMQFSDAFHQTLKAYDAVIVFIDNTHNLFASHAVICACSTFIVSLHGVSVSVSVISCGESGYLKITEDILKRWYRESQISGMLLSGLSASRVHHRSTI